MSKNLEIHVCVLGPVMTNCYILTNKNTREAILVDPADEPQIICRSLEKLGAKPVCILLTHGHFDHILAVPYLKEKYGIPVIAEKEEANLLEKPALNMTYTQGDRLSLVPDYLADHLEVMEYAEFKIQVLHTPGHTQGSCCYYFAEENTLISGDTLFLGSVGRTDLPTGNSRKIMESLHMLLETLPEETEVYPGHDRSTSIGYEKRYNPFA